MKVWADIHMQLHSSRNVQPFDSIAAAKREFKTLYDWYDTYIGTCEHPTMLVWREHPHERRDDYPDRMFVIGKRGGVKEECV